MDVAATVLVLTFLGGITVCSFKEVTSYFRKNRQGFQNINDYFDQEDFDKFLIPFYESITTILEETVIGKKEDKGTIDKLTAYEKEKKKLLNDYDISMLLESIKFQDHINDLETNRAERLSFNSLKSKRRNFLIVNVILGILSIILLGLGGFILKNTPMKIANIIGIIFTILFLICSLFCLLIWKLKIDQYYEKTKSN